MNYTGRYIIYQNIILKHVYYNNARGPTKRTSLYCAGHHRNPEKNTVPDLELFHPAVQTRHWAGEEVKHKQVEQSDAIKGLLVHKSVGRRHYV